MHAATPPWIRIHGRESGFFHFSLEQGAHLMGDWQNGVLRTGFEPRPRLALQGAKISSDAGPWASRELDEAAKLTESAA